MDGTAANSYREMTVDELAAALGTPNEPFLLDVREPVEVAETSIAGARNVPLGELQARLDEVPGDRLVVTICQIGHRSAQAAAFLAQQGRTVANLAGGMVAWEARAAG